MENDFVTGDAAGEGGLLQPGVSGERGGVVTARGTGDGLIIRLDARVEEPSLREALVEFLNSRKGFLEGNQVALEWVGLKPSETFVSDISSLLSQDFNISVKSSKLREERPAPSVAFDGSSQDTPVGVQERRPRRERTSPEQGRPPSLFGGMEALGLKGDDIGARSVAFEKGDFSGDALLFDEPDGRLIYATLRSGQKIETEHSVVIFGDVNSGAEIIAGGDIVVLGTLRGVAHAGAYDETGGGRFIFALNMFPTQLRIGSIISRGGSEGNKGAEIARVDGTTIVVEPYQSKNLLIRRRAF